MSYALLDCAMNGAEQRQQEIWNGSSLSAWKMETGSAGADYGKWLM